MGFWGFLWFCGGVLGIWVVVVGGFLLVLFLDLDFLFYFGFIKREIVYIHLCKEIPGFTAMQQQNRFILLTVVPMGEQIIRPIAG